MSEIFVTADLHLGHKNIIKYCDRPFENEDDMNNAIIENWNSVVKHDDIVYHLGDFCFYKIKAKQWEAVLNGTIIHILGNHDKNNGVKSIITHALCEFANKVFLMTHRPPTMQPEVPDFCNFVICGHVHEKWKVKHEKNIDAPIINVGVDQWNFTPVRLSDIINFGGN